MSAAETVALTDRRAWLEARRQGCGASDVAAIGGMSPWASPWSVFAEKVGLVPVDDRDDDEDDVMLFGRDLEPVIVAKFERSTGLHVRAAQQMVHHPTETWCFATLDGLVAEEPGALDEIGPLGVFESKYDHGAPWDDIPVHYLWQVHWQMWVTGLDHAWIAVVHLPFGRPRFRVYEVERDDTLTAHIVATVERFWFDHVVTGRPPEPDGHHATTDAIAAAWGQIDTVTKPYLELDDYRPLVEQFSDLTRQSKLLDWQLDRVKNGIRALIAERGEPDADGEPALSDAFVDGKLAVSWRSQSKTTVDTKALRADHGDRYDIKGTQRVLRLHGRYLP